MINRLLPWLLILTVILTACGPQAAPTMSPADVQGTAVAAAWTMVAATQQAIPTATVQPPTETPSPTPPPTFTPFALQTSSLPTSSFPGALPTATTGSTSADACNHTLTSNPESKMTNLRLDNQTGAPVTLSIYLFKNAYGECGYRGYNLAVGAKTTVPFPVGCYSFGAFVNDPKRPTKTFGGGSSSCTGAADQWLVRITTEVITLSQ